MEACASSVRRSGELSRRCDGSGGVVLSYGGKDSVYLLLLLPPLSTRHTKQYPRGKLEGKCGGPSPVTEQIRSCESSSPTFS